jgi:hypothetical protein
MVKVNATQAVSAKRPTTAITPSGHRYIDFDGIDDELTVTFADMGADATVIKSLVGEIVVEEGLTIGAGVYVLPTEPMHDFLAINRPLTPFEMQQTIALLAAKSDVSYGVIKSRMDLIMLNAVAAEVYDTSLDDDQGAWRSSALALAASYATETLNTSTRGARPDFPAVALIVAQGQKITFFDADDPSLPMWKVFTPWAAPSAADEWWRNTRPVSSVSMKNGLLIFGTTTSTSGVSFVDFAADRFGAYRLPASAGGVASPISLMGSEVLDDSLPALVNESVNDVAITTLSGATINATTGLPEPTIVVATDSGISVILDDGTVVDSSSTSSYFGASIDTSNRVYAHRSNVSTTNSAFTLVGIVDGFSMIDYGNGVPAIAPKSSGSTGAVAIGDNHWARGSNTTSLAILKEDIITPAEGMVAYITSDYNTGYMVGDIKGAWLSSIDTTDLVGSELVTNGGFATDTDWVDQLGGTTGGTVTITGGELVITQGSNSVWMGVSQAIDVTGLDFVTLTGNLVSASSGGTLRLGLHTSAVATGAPNLGYVSWTSTTGEQDIAIDVSAETTVYILVMDGQGATENSHFDNIRCRLADPDRSVNNNGLQVFGTITKTAVATGAELVAYGPFTGTNYFEQPYNPDFDIGTGDIFICGWLNRGIDTFGAIIDRNAGDNTDFIHLGITPDVVSELQFQLGNGARVTGTITVPASAWVFVCAWRESGVLKIAVNGVIDSATVANTSDLTGAQTPTTRIGVRQDDQQILSGSLALLRVSTTAPTAAQILEIYNAELPLFQENAAATLFGASDAVTALDNDDTTGLLHVGTSAGRSVFDGLERKYNTTDAVTTVINTHGGLIMEK